MAIWSLNRTVRFQSTHSLRSATGLVIGLSSTRAVSIHALLAECDGRCLGTMSFHGSFNPRTPCGVRPDTGTGTTGRRMFQSTHSLRSATGCLFAIKTSMIVSIHALLAECDPIFRFHVFILTCFNPRTPCGVRRESRVRRLELRGFNPRTPCGVRQEGRQASPGGTRFNPRTPCGVRPLPARWNCTGSLFQSTHSLRSATGMDVDMSADGEVSIHALLAECDWNIPAIDLMVGGFNPRTPCGVRRTLEPRQSGAGSFNPRTPCGVRPSLQPYQNRVSWFQSTHSLRSATGRRGRESRPRPGFNPRTPCGVRQD